MLVEGGNAATSVGVDWRVHQNGRAFSTTGSDRQLLRGGVAAKPACRRGVGAGDTGRQALGDWDLSMRAGL